MMKTYLLLLFLIVSCIACKKDEKLTKSEPYKNVVYRVQTTDSALHLIFARAVYTDSVKGNIEKDSILQYPGFYNIPATVLKGFNLRLRGISTKGTNFNLKIIDENGGILAQTDTFEHWPVTPFDSVDRYVSTLSVYLP
jgi:hypothetical protein